MRSLFIAAALCLLGTIAVRAKERDWKQGNIIEVSHHHETKKTTTTGGKKKTKQVPYTLYVVEAGGNTLRARGAGHQHHDTGPIQYDTDEDHLYLREPDGRVHKLDLRNDEAPQ